MRKPHHVQNKVVAPSWRQLFRETVCSIYGHQFYVPAGGGYPGLPQSHCYRCGAPSTYGYSGTDWKDPIG